MKQGIQFNSIYFPFHKSNTRSPRTYGYGDSQIKIKTIYISTNYTVKSQE
jgi:hypothetical protein